MAKFKQAYFAHDLSKKFQVFTTVHNSFLGSAAKLLLSNLDPDLSAYIKKAAHIFWNINCRELNVN